MTSLAGVGARRHAILLQRIAEERSRRNVRPDAPRVARVTHTLIRRIEDDAEGASPAKIAFITGDFKGVAAALGGSDTRIEHVSGPNLGRISIDGLDFTGNTPEPDSSDS